MNRVMRAQRGSTLLRVGIGIALIVVSTWAFWPAYRLEVSCSSGTKIPISFPVSKGDGFSIWFLHSYDRAFFQENYEIDSRFQILLRNMTFKSHLNGSGFAYPHFNLRSDGVGELKDIDEIMQKVQFMMGSKDLADHALIFKGKTYHLSDWIEPFDIVEIRVKKRILRWDIFGKTILSL